MTTQLSLQSAIQAIQNNGVVVDIRDNSDYVAKHVPGAIHIPTAILQDRSPMLLSPRQTIIVFSADADSGQAAATQLAAMRFPAVAGYLVADFAEWEANGLPVGMGDIEQILPAEAEAMLATSDSFRFVDVREPHEYASGHAPNAELIPLGTVPEHAADFDADAPTIIICRSGGRSQQAAEFLGKQGVKKLYNVAGGTLGWIAAGLPTE